MLMLLDEAGPLSLVSRLSRVGVVGVVRASSASASALQEKGERARTNRLSSSSHTIKASTRAPDTTTNTN
jgi:hypothetical protein